MSFHKRLGFLYSDLTGTFHVLEVINVIEMKNFDPILNIFTVKVRHLIKRKELLLQSMYYRSALINYHISEIDSLVANNSGLRLVSQLLDFQATEFMELKSFINDNRWSLLNRQKEEIEAFHKLEKNG